jgi:hypothetical protein
MLLDDLSRVSETPQPRRRGAFGALFQTVCPKSPQPPETLSTPGAGCTCSPRNRDPGCTCSPRKIRMWALLGVHEGIRRNPSRMNTYAKCAANPCGMRTSKIIGLKVSRNEHLQKVGEGRELLLPTGVGCTCSPRKQLPPWREVRGWPRPRQCEKMRPSALVMGGLVMGSPFKNSGGGRT